MKNFFPVLVEAKGQALAPSGSLREVGLNEYTEGKPEGHLKTEPESGTL